MVLDLQFKIKNNPKYLDYLHTHSYWYKELNRNPNSLKVFEESMKEDLKLRPEDRINKALQTMEMIQTIISTLK